MILYVIGILVACLIFGSFSAYVASEKGYPAMSWFWLGALFPLIGFLSAIGLPKRSI